MGASLDYGAAIPVSRLVLRRRSFSEQRAIRMIRGERVSRDGDPAIYAETFDRLQQLARRNGLVIRAPASPYLGMDELHLLNGLACTQRKHAHAATFHEDTRLNQALVHCAEVLDTLGVHLPLFMRAVDQPPGAHRA